MLTVESLNMKEHHYIFIIAQLWLKSHQRSTVVLLETGTPGTSREIFSEDADSETRTRNLTTIGIPTENLSAGTRSSCVQKNHSTSRMRRQPQLSNDKCIMMQYTNWINSTPSQQ